MVVWMSANDGDVIKRDKFLHFYRMRKSKDPGYYKSLSRGIGLLGWFSITPSRSEIGSQISFLSLEVVGSSSLDKAPKFFRSWGVLCLVCLSRLFSCFSLSFMSDDDRWLTGTLVLQFLSVLVWRRGTSVALMKQRNILGPLWILTNFFLLSLYFYTFWVWNGLLRFGRIWKLWEKVCVSTFFFLFFFFLLCFKKTFASSF